jgi:2-polyprenyl-3-methyl-5-hydroxy-6-metoxy-1,4-benzoquinol methylase
MTDTPKPDTWDKIREQFENAPYPNTPLEKSPKDDAHLLHINSMVTAYYQRYKRVINTEGKTILDAGCGSGYKSLVLAQANPGAKIVGIDISEKSVELAKKRLEYHGFTNTEFHVLSIYDLASLKLKYDYISCDETLYSLPDINAALNAMRAVLKPEGIIRTNLHSALQRAHLLNAQRAFELLGILDGQDAATQIDLTMATMQALKNEVLLKDKTWADIEQSDDPRERISMNFLLKGDKGFTISDMFTALNSANLDFISMVNWRQWDLAGLFNLQDNIHPFVAMSLFDASTEKSLQLFELLHPVHRLLDFYCGHSQRNPSILPLSAWEDSHWMAATVHLSGQFNSDGHKQGIINCLSAGQAFSMFKNTTLNKDSLLIDSNRAICLLPLFEGPQTLQTLLSFYLKRRPVSPLTGIAITEANAFEGLKALLASLESFDCIMLETSKTDAN